MTKKTVFEQIYEGNLWQDTSSRSCTGSNLEQTATIRIKIPEIIKQYSIKTMLDASYGDFFWMKEIREELQQHLDAYTGGDIVKQLVQANAEWYGTKKIKFIPLDIVKGPIPKVDLIFYRDYLVHLPFGDIQKAVQNFKRSGSIYLLTTTFPEHPDNVDILPGYWWTLNLCNSPFNFPKPLALIDEGYTEDGGIYQDKSLGLWRINDLNLAMNTARLLLFRIKNWIK